MFKAPRQLSHPLPPTSPTGTAHQPTCTTSRTRSEAGDISLIAPINIYLFTLPICHLTPAHLSSGQVLVSSFRQAIKENASCIKDKVVLDLGCGPGAHLAMMCAQVQCVCVCVYVPGTGLGLA